MKAYDTNIRDLQQTPAIAKPPVMHSAVSGSILKGSILII